MAKKEDQVIKYNFPDLEGENFDQERDVLTHKPKINWTAPPTEEGAGASTDEPSTIEDARNEVNDLIKSYKAIAKLAELVQDKIDERVGNYSVQLDPKADSVVIDAIKRSFPEAKDPSKISYAMYKQCLARATSVPMVDPKDILEAQGDPLRTVFGSNKRPEVGTTIIEPIDTQAFQDSAIKKLFELLTPLMLGLVLAQIVQHKLDTPHV